MNQQLKKIETFYTSKDYDGGLEFLDSIKSSLDDSVYHYNLGTFLAKKNELSKARFHFEIAKDLNFNKSMLDNNLKVVKQSLQINTIEKPESFTENLIHGIDMFPRDYFLSFFLIVLLISSLIFKKYKSLSASLILMLIALTPLATKNFIKNKYKQAIVVENSPIFDGPSDIFEQITEAPNGVKIILSQERENNWFFIDYPEPLRGWIKLKHAKLLKGYQNVH